MGLKECYFIVDFTSKVFYFIVQSDFICQFVAANMQVGIFIDKFGDFTPKFRVAFAVFEMF
jgi:hypothetical protein